MSIRSKIITKRWARENKNISQFQLLSYFLEARAISEHWESGNNPVLVFNFMFLFPVVKSKGSDQQLRDKWYSEDKLQHHVFLPFRYAFCRDGDGLNYPMEQWSKLNTFFYK